MIERYSRSQMTAIWGPQNKYKTWLVVELAACEAMAREGIIPAHVPKIIRQKAKINVRRIDQIEKEVRHDVIAFLTSITERVGEEGRYLHWGMTSSDVVDTALSMLMRQAADLLIADLLSLLGVLKEKALIHKETLMVGRSHGMHGEPITFGLKMALWYDEMGRNLQRMQAAREGISFGKMSGAMGTFAHIPPTIEADVCEKLNLKPEPISNQIVQRDRHAQYIQTLALIATSLEKFATEIRHLQRSEVLEVAEPFEKGQKGSSAMPHKRNPVGVENICGLARVVRSHAAAALENIPLWHERDISHSSVERIIIPDSTILVNYMLHRFTEIMRGLSVYPDRMAKNLDQSGGVIFSQRLLLLLIQRGMQREAAYRIVQSCAMKAMEGGQPFQTQILSDGDIKLVLNKKEIVSCFDAREFVRHIETIYKRVFSEEAHHPDAPADGSDVGIRT